MKIIGVFISDIAHDLTIVGSDPAGYTTATYTVRVDLKSIMFGDIEFGGLLMTATGVENYPSFSEDIMGPELMDQVHAQAERFGADLRMKIVDRMDLTGDIKSVRVGGKEHKAYAAILATGTAPRYVGAPDEQAPFGHDVNAYVTCDGFFFRGHDIAVAGGGDSTVEETTFLTKFVRSVTIVYRHDELRASKIMVECAQNNDRIRFVTNKVVSQALGEDKDSVIDPELEDIVTDEKSVLDVTAMSVAIGHESRSQTVRDRPDYGENGYIQVAAPSTQAPPEGVFTTSDVADSHYQQVITAVGSGCETALDVEHHLGTVA